MAKDGKGVKRTYEIEIDKTLCRSCAVCWEICAPDVLGFQAPLNKAIVVTPQACTGCRLCEWLCPDWAVVVRPKTDATAEAVA
ncbi:MAG: ferredoxin [Alphaproteobacteria bacterium]|jgi:NAD-dependent dihydropyrimidine dehydrogenase PreA subunit|nr:ferredoxin [Alphaproteobacteria bacterium]